MICPQFADAVEETTKTESEQCDAEDGQNDNDVIRRHDSSFDHLFKSM